MERDGEEKWYMIHTYTGRENQVKAHLEQRIKSMNAEGDILQVIIPTAEEVEIKQGRRRAVTKKLFPAYILVQMKMSEQSWNVVRNTPGVTSFVSSQDEQGKLIPVPLGEEEVKVILNRMEAGVPQITVGLSKGDSVRIIDGPFIDFTGVIDEISPEKGKVKVLASFFGRETRIELDLLQVEKL